MLLSIIGLAFDLIGAVMIALALFRHSAPLDIASGTVRAPGEAAGDRASGLAGFLLLALGFVLQGVAHLGVGSPASTDAKLIAGLGALLGGVIVAYVVYGTVYIWSFRTELRLLGERGLVVYEVKRKRRGLKFWNFEGVE